MGLHYPRQLGQEEILGLVAELGAPSTEELRVAIDSRIADGRRDALGAAVVSLVEVHQLLDFKAPLEIEADLPRGMDPIYLTGLLEDGAEGYLDELHHGAHDVTYMADAASYAAKAHTFLKRGAHYDVESSFYADAGVDTDVLLEDIKEMYRGAGVHEGVVGSLNSLEDLNRLAAPAFYAPYFDRLVDPAADQLLAALAAAGVEVRSTETLIAEMRAQEEDDE